MNRSCRVIHVVHRFHYGGLENGLVNLINNLPADDYCHTIISLTEIGDISNRIDAPNVEMIALHKPPGIGLRTYFRLYRILRNLHGDVLHTRNLGTLDVQILGFLLRVPNRIHSEHGRDIDDPDGRKKKPQLIRRLLNPLVHTWVTVSEDLRTWCQEVVGIPERKLMQICNGVDTDRFDSVVSESRAREDLVIFGSVTRFSEIKDPTNVVRALSQVVGDCRLIMAGDGPLLQSAKDLAVSLGVENRVKFLGKVDDTSGTYKKLDVFVLGSKREGISNTILEAMSSGKAIIASQVGGNPELVSPENGFLVPSENANAISEVMQKFVDNHELALRLGRASRDRAVTEFSLDRMCQEYHSLYTSESQLR